MSDQVETKFTANSDDVLKAIAKQQKEIEKLQGTLRKLHDESVSGGGKSLKTFAEMQTAVIRFNAFLGTAPLALQPLVDQYSKLDALAKSIQDRVEAANTSAVQSLARMGMLGQAPEIMGKLDALGVSRDAAAKAFAGVSNVPQNMTPEEMLAFTQTGAKLNPAFGDGFNITEAAARLRQAQGGGDINRAFEQILIAQKLMRNNAGQLADQGFMSAQQKLIEAGLAPEGALALGAGAAKAGVDSAVLEKIALAVTDRIARTGENGGDVINRALNDRQFAAGAFDDARSLKALRELGGEAGFVMKGVDELKTVDQRDIVAETLDALKKAAPLAGNAASPEQNVRDARAAAIQSIFEATDQAEASNLLGKGFGQFARTVAYNSAFGGIETLTRNAAVSANDVALARSAAESEMLARAGAGSPEFEAFKVKIDALIATLDANTKATQDAARRAPRGPAPADVDRHNEPAFGGRGA